MNADKAIGEKDSYKMFYATIDAGEIEKCNPSVTGGF